MVIKVVLLLDDLHGSKWVREIIAHIQSSTGLKLVLAVVREREARKSKKKFRSVLYRLFRKIDRLLFLRGSDAFLRTKLNIDGVPILRVLPERKGIRNIFPDHALESLRQYQPDVILRFGFGILSGKILGAAEHGVWSLHHDDNDVVRGGPPAFWEWYYRLSLTGVTLQRLTESLDGGEVVDKTFTATDFTSLIRNQNKVFWKGVNLVNRTLDRLAHHGQVVTEPAGYYPGKLFRDPGWRRSVIAFSKLFGRAVKRTWQRVSGFDQWCIFFQIPGSGVPAPKNLQHFLRLTPSRDRFWADPFVVSRDGRHFLFVEEFVYKRGKGTIACITLDSQGNMVGESTTILSALEHLSYPFVFEHDGKYWMIPESAERKSVDLYECVEFPLRWELRKTIMTGVRAFDTTVHHHDSCWWLFQTRRTHEGLSANDDLHIYFTDDLLKGLWQPHPLNPVITDPLRARPAGRIYLQDGQRYRPSQICAPRYGYGISINRIVKLTKSEYAEEKVGEILPQWAHRLRSTHTLNFNPQITILDGQVRRSTI